MRVRKELENNNLISLIPGSNYWVDVFYIDNESPHKLSFYLEFLLKYHSQEIISLPELKSFVDRGYLTYNEYVTKEEKNKPMKIAMITVAASIIVNIVVLFIQMRFYEKKREVEIINKNLLNGPIEVIIKK